MSNGKVNNKRRPNSKGRRNTSKVDKRTSYSKCDEKRSTDINDASYYFTSDEVMKQLTDVSFNQFVGMPFEMPNPIFINQTENSISVPSLMRVYLNPSAGSVDTESMNNVNNGVNLAARQLFLRLSAGNMKSTEYGPEDVGLAMLGIGQLLAFMSYIRRFFGLVYLTSNRNRIVPNGLINMLGINAEDFVAHISDYRARYNYLVDLASRIPFPANIKYFEKCNDIYAHIYADASDSQMAQLIAFLPNSVWEFSDTYSDMGSGLHTVPVAAVSMSTNPTKTMGDLLDQMSTLINGLFNSTALLKVYSDILRLSEKGEITLLTFPILQTDYTVIPEYNPEIVRMVHNCTIVGQPVYDFNTLPNDEIVWNEDYHPTKANDVRGNAGSSTIDYYPAFQTDKRYSVTNSETIIDFDHQNPSVSEIVESTRLCSVMTDWYHPEDGEATKAYTTYVALPDHYVVGIDIVSKGVVHSNVTQSNLPTNSALLFELMTDMSKFSLSPLLYLFNAHAMDGEENQIITNLVGDLDWYTTIDYRYPNRIYLKVNNPKIAKSCILFR
uniref:Capsid protein n=1 Tax=Dromedary picobirnavirus TaxID=1574421 RepID=A0A0A1ELB6_9VIRU|nr:capsid protein [Dromedary picobirnavirus]